MFSGIQCTYIQYVYTVCIYYIKYLQSWQVVICEITWYVCAWSHTSICMSVIHVYIYYITCRSMYVMDFFDVWKCVTVFKKNVCLLHILFQQRIRLDLQIPIQIKIKGVR